MILTYLILAIVFNTNVPILTSALVHSMLKRSSFLSSVTSKEVEELHPPPHTHIHTSYFATKHRAWTHRSLELGGIWRDHLAEPTDI